MSFNQETIEYVYNFETKLWESESLPTFTRKELPAFLKQKLAEGVNCFTIGSYGARYQCYEVGGQLFKRRIFES